MQSIQVQRVTAGLVTTGPGKGIAVGLLLLSLLCPAQTPTRIYKQRGKIKSISPTQLVLEAIDLPAPRAFVLSDSTDSSFLRVGELVQVTFVVAGDLLLARDIAEIVATPINLPRGLPRERPAQPGNSSASANLPRSAAGTASASVDSVHLPTGTATSPHTLATEPISLAADESQLAHIRPPEMHQSGVRSPIRLAILDLQPIAAADLTPELPAIISDRLASLLQNDALFTIVRDPALNANDLQAFTAKGIDAILTGEIREDFPSSGEEAAPGQRRRIKAAALPTLTLTVHLTDTRTGAIVGSTQGVGRAAEDRPDDRTPPFQRTLREAIEALASAIDPEYPELLDSRTFVTVAAVEPGRLTVTFPAAPTVQLGSRLQVSHPTWFTRDPATGNIAAVTPEPLGTLTITNLEKSEAAGTYQGTAPTPGQTVRLTR